MKSALLWFCILLLISIACGQDVGSEEITIMKHPLTDMPGPSEDVLTATFFPDSPDLKLPIGEVVTSLCHFSNFGRSNYNISAIMGSLNAPFDFRHHYQNYSYKPFGIVIHPGEEVTMKYTFQLHPELEPVDYQLAITVFYDSDTESFSNTFFNQTVELYLPTSEYDLETLSSVLYSLLTTAVVVLVVVFACFPESKYVQRATILIFSSSSSKADDDWEASSAKKKQNKKFTPSKGN